MITFLVTLFYFSKPRTGTYNSHSNAKWSPIKTQDHKIASPAGAGVSPFNSGDKRSDKYSTNSDASSNWGPFKNREQFNEMHFC